MSPSRSTSQEMKLGAMLPAMMRMRVSEKTRVGFGNPVICISDQRFLPVFFAVLKVGVYDNCVKNHPDQIYIGLYPNIPPE